MHYAKVSVIVLNWNGKVDTLECLESVRKIDYPSFDIIVVDNGSADDSVKAIKKEFPEVILIETGGNLGFAGGNNVGIHYALDHGAEYIWLLNNDTVVDPDALSNMVAEAEKDPGIGIAGSKIYYYNSSKKIWFAGAKINWSRGMSNHIGMNETDTGQYGFVKEMDRVTGCSMLVKKQVCDRVGLFDETFFLYVEEVDWCVRARKAGFKCIFVPSSVVYHKGSISVSRVGIVNNVFKYYNTRNFLYLIKKSFNFPVRETILISVILVKLRNERKAILKKLFSSLNYPFKLEPSETPVIFAIRDFFKKKTGRVDYRF